MDHEWPNHTPANSCDLQIDEVYVDMYSSGLTRAKVQRTLRTVFVPIHSYDPPQLWTAKVEAGPHRGYVRYPLV